MGKSVFSGHGMTSGGILHVSAREAFALITRGVILVDLRPEHEVAHKSFDVPGIIRCPYYEFEKHIDLFPADQAVIIADAVGIHSKAAILLLMGKGYQNIANLAGGFVDWEREGFPIKVNSSEALSGPCLCMLRPMRKRRGATERGGEK